MNATELDDALASAATPVSPAAAAEAARMAYAAMPARMRRGGAPRSRWIVPALVIGAVALTGGVGTAALTMSHWAQVSMPIDNVRNEEPIPLTWLAENGMGESCRVWVELRNPEAGDRDRLDEAILAKDWSGIGQRLYNGISPAPENAEAEAEVSDAFAPVLHDFVNGVFPGIPWYSDDVEASVRGVDATGMTCAPVTP